MKYKLSTSIALSSEYRDEKITKINFLMSYLINKAKSRQEVLSLFLNQNTLPQRSMMRKYGKRTHHIVALVLFKV